MIARPAMAVAGCQLPGTRGIAARLIQSAGKYEELRKPESQPAGFSSPASEPVSSEIAMRTRILLADLLASLRIVAAEETDAGELHFAIKRAIANTIRIELLSAHAFCDEEEVERILSVVLRE